MVTRVRFEVSASTQQAMVEELDELARNFAANHGGSKAWLFQRETQTTKIGFWGFQILTRKEEA